MKDTDYINSNYIVLCTKHGIIKKTTLEAYSRPRTNGINAIVIREGDQLLEAKLTNGNMDIMIAVKSGKAIRFNESAVRPMGRVASGVKAINVSDEDETVGMICIDTQNAPEDVLVVSENGFGKRSGIEEYRITNRGGKGVICHKLTEKTGRIVNIAPVSENEDIMLITNDGTIIRTPVSGISTYGRTAAGVIVN